MITPDSCRERLRQSVTGARLQIIFSVFITGLLAHAFIFVNYLPNWDGLNNFYSDQNTIALGRCFLTAACGISSYYDLPWINGLLSLLYLCITAVLTGELLQLQTPFSRILLGGLLAAFPAATSIFSYMYTADGYFLSMLCMTAAVYLSLRRKWGMFPGALLMAFGFGCYQAFITFAAMLVIVWSIDRLLYRQDTLKTLAAQWLRCLSCAATGLILYYIANTILQHIQHVTPSDYQGIGDLGTVSPHLAFPAALRQCLVDFIYFFTGSLRNPSWYSVLNSGLLLLLLAGGIAAAVRMVKNTSRQLPGRLLCLILFAAAVPFTCFAVYFISSNVSYHMLMHYGLFFVYALLLVFYDRAAKIQSVRSILYQWCCLIVCGLLLYQFILTANICYQRQNVSVQASMNVLDDMADAIIALPDFDRTTEIAVIGTLPDSEATSILLPPDMTGFTDGYIMSHSLHYSNALARYHHITLAPADEARIQELSADRRILEMPIWPAAGSVAVIEHTVVIRLSDK